MAKTATSDEPRPRARRLSAIDRRRTILDAARQSFGDVGDIAGTTMRTIAERAGISEGVIYRHFESKEQLFYEAVVEPLREAVDTLVQETEAVDTDVVLTTEGQHEALTELYARLTATLAEVLPLLGLVLFGDPTVARRFYREHFSVAMDRLAGAWAKAEALYGLDIDLAAISARAVMGGALVLALESAHGADAPTRDTFERFAVGAAGGYFPPIEPV
jgi:AcrR family transcriptional regulator